jgi:hypothetical protein
MISGKKIATAAAITAEVAISFVAFYGGTCLLGVW